MTMTGGGSGAGGDWTEVDDLDIWTVDRLLDGHIAHSELPDGYDQIATLVGVVRSGVAPAMSGWGSPTVPAMSRALAAPARVAATRARSRVRPWRIPNAAAIVVVVGALSAGTAAAATDSLPGPVQSAVASAGAALGVPIPAPDPHDPGAGHSSRSGLSGSSRSSGTSQWSGSSGAVGSGSRTSGPGTGTAGNASPLVGGLGGGVGPATAPHAVPAAGSGGVSTPAENTSPDSQPPTTNTSDPSQNVTAPAVTPTTPPPTVTPPTTIPPSRGKNSGGPSSKPGVQGKKV